MISASKLSLAAHCAGSMVLPQAGTYSQAAEDGTARHEFFERAPEVGLEAALAAAPAHLRPLLEMLADHPIIVELIAEKSLAEVPLAYDWVFGTGRVLPSRGHRDYSQCLSTEIPGTADRVAFPDDDTVLIHDFKGREHQAPAAEHLQLRFLALAAAAAYGRSRAIVAWVKTMDGVPQVDYANFDAFDLAAIAADVVALAERVDRARRAREQGDRPRFERGPWCRRCDGFDSCEAQHELLQIAVRKPEQLANEAEVALTNGGRAHAYEMWRALELLAKRVGERVSAHAAMRPIDLGNGRAYGFAPGRRQVEDEVAARRVLREAGVAEEVLVAAFTEDVVLSTTLGAIEKAVRSLPKEQREPVMERLRAAGAVKQGVALKEHDAAAAAGSEAA